MADFDKTYPFTQKNVDAAPDEHGVYILYDGDEIIYIGRAAGRGVSIRSRLQDHFAGRDGRCTQGATHYARERNSDPIRREAELLQWFEGKFGQLPRCNERRA